MSRFDNGSDSDSKERYALNFSISHKDPRYFRNDPMSSNIISETSLEDDHILIQKKSLLKRKKIASEKIFYREIIDLDLIKSGSSSLYSSIDIVYSRNGYSKRHISLSSSDAFAVRWFYDALVVKYSLFRSDLNDKNIFKSNESEWIENNRTHESFNNNQSISSDDSDKTSLNKGFKKESNQSKLSDFINLASKELSEEEERKLNKKMKFERCSSGEY